MRVFEGLTSDEIALQLGCSRLNGCHLLELCEALAAERVGRECPVMTGEKWQSAWQIYSAVREMPLSERRSFLDSASSDREIISEVLLLLEQSERHAPEPVTRHTMHAVGSQVSRYVLLSELGRGGMGQVFSARDTELGRNVALKFLNFETAIHSEAAQKLLREAQIASALNHLNIVTIHEVIRSETSIAIVMELVEGQSLRQMCKKRLPIEEVIPIGRQIAGALATAHAQGILHRDIKPENMMLRPDGCIKVLDFGLARQLSNVSELSNASLPAGTLRYMSPSKRVAKQRLPPATFSLSGWFCTSFSLASTHFPEKRRSKPRMPS